MLHERLAGQAARAATPLEIVSVDPGTLRKSALVLFSASGRNADILAAARAALRAEPPVVIVVTVGPGTPLGHELRDQPFAELVELDLTTNGDGFLATNSLLAFAVLLYRAYREIAPIDPPPPATLDRLLGTGFNKRVTRATAPLWNRSTLVVLHGLATKPAALDLESKFSEAALGNVQLADFRNFAHGRHHWLAKHGGSTAVLGLIGPQDESLAAATLHLLPKSTPVVPLRVIHDGMLAGLAALAQGLFVVGAAGRAKGIDPGRPGVPRFGRQLYSLRTIGTVTPKGRRVAERLMEVAIRRKVDAPWDQVEARGELGAWAEAYRSFVRALGAATFRGLVLDYDGTLVAERDRFTGPDPDTLRDLVRVLGAGIPVGVASGRGRSVGDQLREFVPSTLWKQTLVGYYNGSEIACLDDSKAPSAAPGVCEELSAAAQAIGRENSIMREADVTIRYRQITLQPKARWRTAHVWGLVHELLLKHAIAYVQVVRSSHSIDILPPGVTKLAVAPQLRSRAGVPEDAALLCIGDHGQWPGNDAALLTEPYSLSVDEVSHDPVTCWNLAPPGVRGVVAARGYLKAIRPSRNRSFTFRLGSA